MIRHYLGYDLVDTEGPNDSLIIKVYYKDQYLGFYPNYEFAKDFCWEDSKLRS